MRRLLAAIAFLTRIPVHAEPPLDGSDVGRGTALFPLVGGFIGASQAGAVVLAVTIGGLLGFAVPHVICALVATASMLMMTGALHQDALADMADGFGGGRKPADVLRIMRDHVIGAYGTVALIVSLGLRVAALTYLFGGGAAVYWLLTAGALSRWSSTVLGACLPYARNDGGMGSAVTDHVGTAELVVSSAIALTIAVACVGWMHAIICAIAALVVAADIGRRCRRRIGGVTGDTLGAASEVAEVVILCLGAGAL